MLIGKRGFVIAGATATVAHFGSTATFMNSSGLLLQVHSTAPALSVPACSVHV